MAMDETGIYDVFFDVPKNYARSIKEKKLS